MGGGAVGAFAHECTVGGPEPGTSLWEDPNPPMALLVR